MVSLHQRKARYQSHQLKRENIGSFHPDTTTKPPIAQPTLGSFAGNYWAGFFSPPSQKHIHSGAEIEPSRSKASIPQMEMCARCGFLAFPLWEKARQKNTFLGRITAQRVAHSPRFAHILDGQNVLELEGKNHSHIHNTPTHTFSAENEGKLRRPYVHHVSHHRLQNKNQPSKGSSPCAGWKCAGVQCTRHISKTYARTRSLHLRPRFQFSDFTHPKPWPFHSVIKYRSLLSISHGVSVLAVRLCVSLCVLLVAYRCTLTRFIHCLPYLIAFWGLGTRNGARISSSVCVCVCLIYFPNGDAWLFVMVAGKEIHPNGTKPTHFHASLCFACYETGA